MSKAPYYIGVDVGTGSARAALLDSQGHLLAESTHATQTWRSEQDSRIFEQSTCDIWAKICAATQACLAQASVKPEEVKGIGFDATCSLAVVDAEGMAIEVTPEGKWRKGSDVERNIILWADHRAEQEAKLINESGSMILDYVGGTMSTRMTNVRDVYAMSDITMSLLCTRLEMEIPKILWLSKHMPSELFSQAHFYDLPDYLTYRATGSGARSNCSLVCKCSYVPPGVGGSTEGWQRDFFAQIGLEALVDEGFKRVGGIPGKGGLVLTAGQPVGEGLTDVAAKELGLSPGTPVGSALIDAYAGWVGTVAATATNGKETAAATKLEESKHRLAAIAGTSTCHVVQSPQGVDVRGVWGPYKHAVFPGMWMNEGGQSSTGQLIDFVIDTHPASASLREQAAVKGSNLFAELESLLASLSKSAGVSHASYLTRDIILYPDLHGNRSPLADSSMRGLHCGLSLDRSTSDLAKRYHATLEAIALQTRHILSTLNVAGHSIEAIYMSGGHVKNKDLMQMLADVCQIPVLLPASASASVVIGSAILGRFAAEVREKEGKPLSDQNQAEKSAFDNRERLWQLMSEMTKPGTFVFPAADARLCALFEAKYKIFHEAIETQRRWRKMVADAIDK